ncbi:MAG: YdcF family protein [Sphingobacteriaceae bacterium]|nr:YdcF family protein [Sphingobacteriaceae bacterium]
MKKIVIWILSLLTLVSVIVCWANYKINSFSELYIYNSTDSIPTCKTAILLGTSKFMRSGTKNYFFYNRIKAAETLFKSGKVQFVIISGDNSLSYYNEPEDMKKELMKAGVPDSCIFLDYAGFRTFDSMIRAKEVFGQTKFIVVSQEFHNERAIFIARKYGIEAYGYNAEDVSAASGFKTKVRELFARVKVFIDVYSNKQPKFLGNKIIIQ